MATYTVTRVRRETSVDGSHEHIEGICTDMGIHYTRKEVFDSICGGDVWLTVIGGFTAEISTQSFCPAARCLAAPYLKTNPDSTLLDNLENLPPC
ncbi:MAG: hypothetical protein QOE45_1882 [Frankiaceae bacterium]|jgi:hypothetical protein|nr:hypothetical protein [Frankiaceae bacterium]